MYTDEEKELIIKLYNEGLSHDKIAEALGKPQQRTCVTETISKMKKAGILGERKRLPTGFAVKKYAPQVKQDTKLIFHPGGYKEYEPIPGTCVDCDKVYRSCVYGSDLIGKGKCNYSCITNHTRGRGQEDPRQCSKYIKRDKEHPKLRMPDNTI